MILKTQIEFTRMLEWKPILFWIKIFVCTLILRLSAFNLCDNLCNSVYFLSTAWRILSSVIMSVGIRRTIYTFRHNFNIAVHTNVKFLYQIVQFKVLSKPVIVNLSNVFCPIKHKSPLLISPKYSCKII